MNNPVNRPLYCSKCGNAVMNSGCCPDAIMLDTDRPIDWLETQHVNFKDAYFLVGRNPEKNGGGLIATSPRFESLIRVKLEAIKRNYDMLQIMDADSYYAIR